jgi:integrase
LASIAKRPDGHWRARYRDAIGKEHARHFARKVDAQARLDGVNASIRTGAYVDPGRGRITVGAFARHWLAGKINLKPTTRARYADVLNTHVIARWGDLPLTRVGYGDIQSWLAELADCGLSAASVRKAHSVLSGILGLAVKDRRLPSNPALGVALPPLESIRRRYLTAELVEQMADAAGTGRLPVLVLAYCGLRWSELAALRVRHVDLLRRRLSIEEAVTEVNGARIVWGTPKSHEARSVPTPRSLATELEACLDGKGPEDLLFTSPYGAVLRNRNARSAWFDAAAAAIGQPGLTPHELRHTAASLAVSAGANVKAVQRMLGHASAAMTLDTYADLFDDDLDEVADRLDAVRASAARTPADFLRTEPHLIKDSGPTERPETQQMRDVQRVETRRLELPTPALQRRCSAN